MKCKTCGRNISYGYGNSYYNHFEQKVGKSSRDSWTKAIEQNCTILNPDSQGNVIDYEVKNLASNQRHHGSSEGTELFCRLNCLNVFLGVHYDLIRNLPNIVEK
tara:strand:+ start:182 stop:493 length:312 start_codon:yes stop_codon:yes gene_type:complete